MPQTYSLKSIQRTFFILLVHIGEGTRAPIIDTIASEVSRISGAILLEVKPNPELDRTQFIIATQLHRLPEIVIKMARAASKVVDLPSKKKNFPGVGALDSVMIIPLLLRNLPLAASAARDLGKDISQRFRIPVFLCGKAAQRPEYSSIRHFRHWTYRDFPQAIQQGKLFPDFGGNEWNPHFGAVLCGARLYYISFAIYLDTEDVEIVEEFARSFTGYIGEEHNQKEKKEQLKQKVRMHRLDILRDVHTVVGVETQQRMVKLLGKITDYQKTPFHEVYAILDRAFQFLGIKIIGSQIFGFIPLEVLQQAGKYFFKGKSFRYMDDLQFFTLALNRIRVDAVEPFHRDLQVLEYRIKQMMEMQQKDGNY